MTVYVPSSAAEILTQALWLLANPYSADSETKTMFGVVFDLNGGKWIEVDVDFSITVHADAVLNGLANILQPWIDEGLLPHNTNENLTALVENLRGQQLTVYDAFPDLFKSMAKTREQMIAEGLLPAPPTP